MTTEAQGAEWLKRNIAKKAVRIQLFNEATSTLIYEWAVEDLSTNHVEATTMIFEVAQEECNRAQVGDQMYKLQARNEKGKVTGNLVVELIIDPNFALQKVLDSQGGFAGIALTQILQHRNKDQQQQHHATQAALKIVLETNAMLMADRAKTNTLLSEILTKMFELRIAQLEPSEDGDDTVIQEAWAVQLDKVTDGAIKEFLPRLGNLFDEGSKQLLADNGKKRPGRPKGSKTKKTKTTNAKKNGAATP